MTKFELKPCVDIIIILWVMETKTTRMNAAKMLLIFSLIAQICTKHSISLFISVLTAHSDSLSTLWWRLTSKFSSILIKIFWLKTKIHFRGQNLATICFLGIIMPLIILGKWTLRPKKLPLKHSENLPQILYSLQCRLAK